MKRNPDLIRAIALAMENLPAGEVLASLDGIDQTTFVSHVQLMLDAGLVEARVLPGAAAVVKRLTWSGCDFADAARSDSLWAKAKQSVIAPTVSWTFSTLMEWLRAEIKQGLPSLGKLAG